MNLKKRMRKPMMLGVMFLCSVRSLDNGLALTAPMGLSTWSIFRSNVNDTLIRELADALVTSGLAKAGYNYLLVDDGWAGQGCKGCLPNRNASGSLVVDETKFPNGLSTTVAYVHSKGLKFGLWFGHSMCATSNDTLLGGGYAALDAAFFAAAGVDAIKHDNCVDVANTTASVAENYKHFADFGAALNATGRPMLYDVVLQVAHERAVPSYDYGYLWSPEVYGKEAVQKIANTWWSLPVNKYNCWSCCVSPSESIVSDSLCTSATSHAARRGLLPMIDTQDMGTVGFSKAGHWDWAGPHKGWNHIDQLAVCVGESWYGPGLSAVEQMAQLSLWAVLASPLLVSMDVRAISDECKALVTNRLALAVHQDPAGVPGRRIRNIMNATTVQAQVWCRPLAGGAVAAVLFNRGEAALDISTTFEELGLPPSVKAADVVDVWTGKTTKRATSPFTAALVEAHGVMFVTLTPCLE